MSLKEALLVALRALRAHRLRSTLTMLGLIIGVSAVVLLATCGQGVRTPSMHASNPWPTTSPSWRKPWPCPTAHLRDR